MKSENTAGRQLQADTAVNRERNICTKSEKPKVIDCFLFFQELDLLEIRLRYLKDVVDIFVIVEACQTFTGTKKDYIFEDNKPRYSKYLEKIKYYKIEGNHLSYESVLEHLDKNNIGEAATCAKRFMEGHTHYDKTKLHYVLDTYHRECIHIVLEEIGTKDIDVVMISDLDEIPSQQAIEEARRSLNEGPYVLRQREFSYFLNYYKNADWLGTIIGEYGKIKRHSLNELRIDSKSVRRIISKKPIETGGYHFTTCGTFEDILNKIKSWAHQEFNNKYVISNLSEKIRTGQDPFSRKTGTIFRRVELNEHSVYDEKMQDIIKDYDRLLSPEEIVHVDYSLAADLLRKMYLYGPRLKEKIMAVAKSSRKLLGL